MLNWSRFLCLSTIGSMLVAGNVTAQATFKPPAGFGFPPQSSPMALTPIQPAQDCVMTMSQAGQINFGRMHATSRALDAVAIPLTVQRIINVNGSCRQGRPIRFRLVLPEASFTSYRLGTVGQMGVSVDEGIADGHMVNFQALHIGTRAAGECIIGGQGQLRILPNQIIIMGDSSRETKIRQFSFRLTFDAQIPSSGYTNATNMRADGRLELLDY